MRTRHRPDPQRWERQGLEPRVAPRATVHERPPDADTLAAADAGARIDAVAGLQATAGNRAVAALVGVDASPDPDGADELGGDIAAFTTRDAPKGLREVSDEPPAGLGLRFGHTVGTFDSAPPLFEVAIGDSADGGKSATVKRPIPSRAPDHKVSVVGGGIHDAFPNMERKRFVNVDGDWPATIRRGEQEHVDDETLAWEVTWKAIGDAIAAVAAEGPVTAATAEAAREAAWSKVLAQLPRWLHPRDSSEAEQLRAWSNEPRSVSPVRQLVTATQRIRDKEGWHTPGFDPSELATDGDTTQRLVKGDSRIDEVKTAELIARAIKEIEATAAPPPKRSTKRSATRPRAGR